MTDREFRALLNLFMCSDPWPIEPAEQGVMLNLLDKESEKRGFPDWVEAYHRFEPAYTGSKNQYHQDPKTP